MLLNLDTGLGVAARAVLHSIRYVSPRAPVDIVKVFLYRRECFGGPFCAVAQAALRGKSSWPCGERELLGAFVSNLNHCVF